jgi:hypothetical protein
MLYSFIKAALTQLIIAEISYRLLSNSSPFQQQNTKKDGEAEEKNPLIAL